MRSPDFQLYPSLRSEWIKRRRSLATTLVISGGFFTPIIVIIARLVKYETLPAIYQAQDFWIVHWKTSWESMAIFLLPIGVIMATSLITQLEFRNNTWKQLHAAPVRLTTVFFSKMIIILFMMLQFFVLFNGGILLSALTPWLLVNGVSFPAGPVPWEEFLRDNVHFFLSCLPIIGLQYLISLMYRNFLIPLGAGFLLWVTSIAALRWKYGYWIPYTYSMYQYLLTQPDRKMPSPLYPYPIMAFGYFFMFSLVAYVLYLRKPDRS